MSTVSSSASQLAPGRGVDRLAPAVLDPGPGERRVDLVRRRRSRSSPGPAPRRTATRCAPARCRRRRAPARRRGRAGGRRGRSRRRRAPGSAPTSCAAEHDLAHRVAADHARARPLPLPQRGVEGAQRRGEVRTGGTRRPAPTAPGRARTAAAPPSLVAGVEQGGVVGEAEVAAEPHHGCRRARRPLCQAARTRARRRWDRMAG